MPETVVTQREIPTVAQLRADAALLLRTIGGALEPGPWQHRPVVPFLYGEECEAIECRKCGTGVYCDTPCNCPVPEPFSGPLEVAADKLLRAIPSRERYKIFEAIPMLHDFPAVPGFCSIDEMEYKYAMWFFWADPTDRCICALLALGAAKEN